MSHSITWLIFLSVYFCSSSEKNANKPPFSSPCSFIYISYYLEATAVVNIVSACVVMCVVPVCLSLKPLFSIRLCYVCLCFPFLHSGFGRLVFCLLRLLCTWCLACGSASTLLVVSRHCLPGYLCTRRGILASRRCSVGVISPPSLVLSLSICYHMPQSRRWPFSLTAS